MKLLQMRWSVGQFSQPLDAALVASWDSPQTLILAFFSPSLAHAGCWQELRNSFPLSVIAGCSGSGEIAGEQLEDEKAIITFCRFDKSQLRPYTAAIADVAASYSSGQALARALPQQDLRGIFILSEGLQVNGTELIAGIHSVLPREVLISGGLAGDGTAFKKTWVLGPDGPATGLVSAIGFYGKDLVFTCAAQGGWIPFGPARKITRSEANVLYEIDGRPALQLYREYLGKLAKDLPASGLLFPMQVETQGDMPRKMVRTLLAIDEKQQSLTFAGDIPEGASARLMQVSINNLISAAHQSGETCLESCKDKQQLALSLVVSCVGRRLVMGEKTEDELEAISRLLPAGSIQTGFYSYGEIAPGNFGFADLHNQTMTLALIQEK